MASALKKLLWALKLPYLPEAIRAVVRGPYTVKFPFGETYDTGNYRGAVVWDKDVCIGCGACAEVCPAGAISMVDDAEADPPVRRFTLDYGRCIFCGHCHYNCTTDDGIYQTTDWDLATFDPAAARTDVEKELLMCEKCGCVIAPRDHVLWVAHKVGPKAYANPTLALTLEGGLVTVPPVRSEPGKHSDRSDIMRVVCPHCRRVVVLSEAV
jgi:hydrogenase-4 component H